MLLNISEKIEPAFALVLSDLAALATAQEIEFLVVGAMARDLIFECGFGIRVGRATRDIDFGIRVEDWDSFQQLTRSLTTNDWHCAPRQQHRFVHPNGVPVDLIPFGGVASAAQEIKWPPNFNEKLSVLGFDDALIHSWSGRIQHSPTLDIRLASPACQALLKLAAWRDRGAERGGRDAVDLRFLMERYLDLDNVERVVDEFPEWLTEDFDYRIASARLLGTDLVHCISTSSLPELTELITAIYPVKPEKSLAYAMSRSGDTDDLASSQALVDAFYSALPN